MVFRRCTRPDFSLDEVIENLQRESDAAVLTARAALGGPETHRRLDIPRRFPDLGADVLPDGDQRHLPLPGGVHPA
jgi:hypothetical protein